METQEKKSNSKKWVLIILFGVILLGILIIVLYNKHIKNEEKELSNQPATLSELKSAPSLSIPHTPIKVVFNKKFGLTRIIMCLAQDTNWIMIQQECTDLVKNETFAFVYCYDDKAKIKNINIYKDALDALPDEGVGYISELKKIPDEGFSFTKIVKNLKK
jgi:hypothetical protein